VLSKWTVNVGGRKSLSIKNLEFDFTACASLKPACSFDFQTLPHAHINMWILPLVGYIGVTVGFCFLTLAIGINNPIKEERSDANLEPTQRPASTTSQSS